MRRFRLRKRLPRVAKRSPRSSIIGAGSPIGARRRSGARTFAVPQLLVLRASHRPLTAVELPALSIS